jgi:bifunctional ADP-heptose synthase (sugar kinase/adenylyltransferase)
LGGALAIARHISNYCDETEMVSIMGPEQDISELIKSGMPEKVKLSIVRDNAFVTAVKKRYLKQHPQRGDNEKLFSINYLNETENLQKVDFEPLRDALKKKLPQYDLIVVCDYGHGLIDSETMSLIQNNSKFLAINCQTNSSNYGMNIITKYDRADTFALDEKELALAFREYGTNKGELLSRLCNQLHAEVGWLTIGAKGASVKSKNESVLTVPALTLRVTDTIGAGDAFFALSSLAAAAGVPADIATLLANAAGAIKTHMIGNKGSVGKKELLKYVKTVLNV